VKVAGMVDIAGRFVVGATCLFGVAHVVGAQPAAAERPDLTGTAWRLLQFQGGDDTTLKPDDPSKYTIAFERDGRLVARLDCNRGRGTWTSTRPGQLELGPLASTRAMCLPGSLHDQLARQWSAVRTYLVRDGHLFLSLMADGGIYEFEPHEPPASSPAHVAPAAQVPVSRPLEGPRWAATRLGETTVTATGPRAPHLVFTAARVAGSDGCNRVSGGYTVDGQAITFGAMIGTQMACPGTGEVERAFGAALRATRSWRISGSSLDLLDAKGEVVARFEAEGGP
jgi:heat shock protein HslJ